MRRAAVAPSARRTRLISSGDMTAEPQSPAVMLARCACQPCSRTSRIKAPAQRNSASSGWARTLNTTGAVIGSVSSQVLLTDPRHRRPHGVRRLVRAPNAIAKTRIDGVSRRLADHRMPANCVAVERPGDFRLRRKVGAKELFQGQPIRHDDRARSTKKRLNDFSLFEVPVLRFMKDAEIATLEDVRLVLDAA